MRLRQIASSSGLTAIVCIAILILLSGCALFRVTAADLDRGDGNTLLAFRSDDQIRRFLRERNEYVRSLEREGVGTVILVTGSIIVQQEDYSSAELGEYIESGAVTTGQAITNTQETAVDEGGIVKMFSRDIMVVLRRGRIFTISVSGGNIRPLDSIDAYPPGVNAQDDWYDEMLVAENRVIVIGYSYERGGTEINRFRIDDAGGLEFEDSHHFTSADYYSSSNYASRLIGNELVFYTEVYLPYRDEDPIAYFPTLSRWRPVAEERTLARLTAPENVYIPAGILEDREIAVEALHTVTRCDLSAPALSCRATGVLGPENRSFYVSRNAVYVWSSKIYSMPEANDGEHPAFVLRLAFDEEVPRGVVATGAPMDQFSFREDYRRGVLNVLIGSENNGDAFWSGERSEGQFALVTIPIDEFGDGGDEIDATHYAALPSPEEAQYFSQNRFVGDYILYDLVAEDEDDERRATLIAARVSDGEATWIPLEHGVDRIDIMGGDAVVIGTNAWNEEADLYFSTVTLSGSSGPSLADSYVNVGAEQAESRSHAFFFRPDPRQPEDPEMGTSGVLGLPVARPGRGPFMELFENSAALIFLRRANGQFARLGKIPARPETVTRGDDCVASCYDWYGNARPIFLGERIFALLGYELAEARVEEGAIEEIARVSFAPGTEGAHQASVP